ncbi:MAG: DUF2063 domain-containing protein [Congregibacter sp.]
MSQLREAQREMASFLRDPNGQNPPAGIEPRRLQIYRDLVYRNIEGFVSSAFPVLRSLYDDAAWESLVRDFIQEHRCATPLFLQISEEFLAFFAGAEREGMRGFEKELAHYEWLELAVDVAEGEVPDEGEPPELEDATAFFSPAAQLASYEYPVHRIGPSFQPAAPAEPCFLLVYRNRDNRVKFMELNAASARLLHEVSQNGQGSRAETVAELLHRLASEWSMDEQALRGFAWEQLLEFHSLAVVGLRKV